MCGLGERPLNRGRGPCGLRPHEEIVRRLLTFFRRFLRHKRNLLLGVLCVPLAQLLCGVLAQLLHELIPCSDACLPLAKSPSMILPRKFSRSMTLDSVGAVGLPTFITARSLAWPCGRGGRRGEVRKRRPTLVGRAIESNPNNIIPLTVRSSIEQPATQ